MLASAPGQCEHLTSPSSFAPPATFGRFKVLHQIGAGVLGPVFRTHDPERGRLVVVKAFTLDLAPEHASNLSARFQRLVDLRIDHPGIAAPVATGIEDFVVYLATPYAAGESLDAAVRQYGPAPPGDAIRLIVHVAEALDHAARLGVFHGSLHPRDVLVTTNETHVTGLGVVQALEHVGLRGPVRRPYVAPEREAGEAWGAPADIYSLGAIAYEVLTGRRALPSTEHPLPALGDLKVRDVAALREAIESALDPDPGRRPTRAREFAAAFAAGLSEGTGGRVQADRAHGDRPRRPRRPTRLPGLDEPLTAEAATAPGKARTAKPPVPVAAPAPEARPGPAVPGTPLAAAGLLPGDATQPPAGAPPAPAEAALAPTEAVPAPAEAALAPSELVPAPAEAASTASEALPAAVETESSLSIAPVAHEAGPVDAGVTEAATEAAPAPVEAPQAPIEPEPALTAAPAVAEAPPPPVDVAPVQAETRPAPAVAPPAMAPPAIAPPAPTAVPPAPVLAPPVPAVVSGPSPAAAPPPSPAAAAGAVRPARPRVPEEDLDAPRAGPDLTFELEQRATAPLTLPEDFTRGVGPRRPAPPETRVGEDELAFDLSAISTEDASSGEAFVRDLDLDDIDILFSQDERPPAAREPARARQEPVGPRAVPGKGSAAPAERGSRPGAESRAVAPGLERRPSAGVQVPPVAEPIQRWKPRVFEAGAAPAAEETPPLPGDTEPRPRLRSSLIPATAGVVAGLAIGLMIGYWVGSRTAAVRPRPVVPRPPAASGPAVPGPTGVVGPPADPAARTPAGAAERVPASSAERSQSTPGVRGEAATPAAPPAAAPATVRPAAAVLAAASAGATLLPDAADGADRGRSSVSGTGSIAVMATPLEANVYLDGVKSGLTPRNLRNVPVGTHTIRVTRPGYASEERQVVLTADQSTVRVEFALSPARSPRGEAAGGRLPAGTAVRLAGTPGARAGEAGRQSLVVESRPPGARVRVDGVDVGTAPVTVSPVTSGKHKLEVQLPGYRLWTETLTVAAGRARQVTATLERNDRR